MDAPINNKPSSVICTPINSLDEFKKVETSIFNPPSFFVSSIKHAYGNDQDLYSTECAKIVRESVGKIREDLSAKKDPKKIFMDLMHHLSLERQRVAALLKTKEAEAFGKWMDHDGVGSCALTLLGPNYGHYPETILGFIQDKLRSLVKLKGTNPNVKNYWSVWGNDESRYYLKVITPDEVNKLLGVSNSKKSISSKKANQIIDKAIELPIIETTDGLKLRVGDLGKSIIHLNNAEAPSSPGNKLCQTIVTAADGKERKLPLAHNMKTAYVLGITVLKIEGVWQTMTSYLTWLYQDDFNLLDETIINKMGEDCAVLHEDGPPTIRKQSQVMIIHNCKKEKIATTLTHTSKIFSAFINTDRNEVQLLKNLALEMQFKLIQLNFTTRGFAAIAKLYQTIIFRLHDYVLVSNQEKFMDLEVHEMPYLPTFIKRSQNNYTLKNIESLKV